MSHLEDMNYENGQIVEFELSEDKKLMRITEACDLYFNRDFDKKEFGEFIEELKVLHSQMIDE